MRNGMCTVKSIIRGRLEAVFETVRNYLSSTLAALMHVHPGSRSVRSLLAVSISSLLIYSSYTQYTLGTDHGISWY